MIKTETLEDFYRQISVGTDNTLPINNTGRGHFNVFQRSGSHDKTPFIRRDYYKITLVRGEGTVYYEDKSIVINRPALIFSGPAEPSSCESASAGKGGYFCLFSPDFMAYREYEITLHDYPFFRLNGEHIITLDENQYDSFIQLFEKMRAELDTSYSFKYELLRSYLQVVMYEALKIGEFLKPIQHINAAARTTAIFLQLLADQFPVDSPSQKLKLKTAIDYANHMAIHINHLNRSVKKITGKTTTRHIAERILTEAQALLKYSDLNINQIAMALGYDEVAYFVNFFKKNTGYTPGNSRLVVPR